jgi:molecular chaperone GrpE (heat shock protein)
MKTKAERASKAANMEDEFASAMQKLSAEAGQPLKWEKKKANTDADNTNSHLEQLTEEVRALHGRLDKMDAALSNRLDAMAEANAATKPVDYAEQFRKLDEQLALIRGTETVNQRLFDSLHDELINYRDNFLHESLQKPFIRDLLLLYDALTALSSQMTSIKPTDNRQAAIGQWRNNLENTVHSLLEVLHRLEVKEVEPKERVDLAVHKVVSSEPAEFQQDDGCIVMRVKRGFFWRDQLLRPEEVIAKRCD